MITDIEKLINNFLEYLEMEKGRSKNTVRNYYFYLMRFAEFADFPKVSAINEELIRQYKVFLHREATQNGLKKSTQNYHMIALRSFLKYLAQHGVKSLPSRKITLEKLPKRRLTIMEGDEIRRLLCAPLESEEEAIIRLRDKAILELLFSTGLRVSELAALQKEHAGEKNNEIIIRGKGLKFRQVFLSNEVKNWIYKYLNERHDMSESLFVRHDKAKGAKEPGNLTPRSIQRIVKRYSLQTGLQKHITPHTLRHSFAQNLISIGADLRSVQTLLGHTSITTTQVYTPVTNKRLKRARKK